jgi:hypothetical protein
MYGSDKLGENVQNIHNYWSLVQQCSTSSLPGRGKCSCPRSMSSGNAGHLDRLGRVPVTDLNQESERMLGPFLCNLG